MTTPVSDGTASKPIHSLVLDTGPLVKNDPPADVLRARAEQLYTLPSIISEIRDAATRSRVETALLPFVTLRSPKPESVKFIQAFARKTGDLEVMSRPDIEVLALGYELECERNGGDWRLRSTPGQQRLNGKSPKAVAEAEAADATVPELMETTETTEAPATESTEATEQKVTEATDTSVVESTETPAQQEVTESTGTTATKSTEPQQAAVETPAEPKITGTTDAPAVESSEKQQAVDAPTVVSTETSEPAASQTEAKPTTSTTEPSEAQVVALEESEPKAQTQNEAQLNTAVSDLRIKETPIADSATIEAHNVANEITQTTLTNSSLSGETDETLIAEDDSSDDEDGWITPSNLSKHKARDANSFTDTSAAPMTLQAAILTSDFAMQNVALRLNLNLVSPSLSRISSLRTWVLRCHACFQITKQMDKRFCPTCGQATLLRAACSVDDKTGKMTVHLKKNFQWNNRGNVYSVPRPVHGSSNGRLPKNMGGQNGWGRELIFAEDQKEYVKASTEQRRARNKDAMDQDYLPNILTGHRSNHGPKIKVGAGRTVNARRKK